MSDNDKKSEAAQEEVFVDQLWRRRYDKAHEPKTDPVPDVEPYDMVDVEVLAARGWHISGYGTKKQGEKFTLPKPLAERLIAEHSKAFKLVTRLHRDIKRPTPPAKDESEDK